MEFLSKSNISKALRILFLITSLNSFSFTYTYSQSKSQTPSDEEIRQILADRINVLHKSVGMVVGIISPQGKRIISYGQINQGDTNPLNEKTLFEIGSVTKLFTSLLLADMIQKGEVKASDPVSKYLPENIKMPEYNGHPITLLDLATHTSGLPFQPSDMAISVDAYANYTDAQLYDFVSNFKLESIPGTHWNYSNLGMGLLAKALANKFDKDYATLIKERITKPLKMKNTILILSSKQKKTGNGT